MLSEGKKLSTSALKTEMDERTARKYRDTGLLPSELKKEHTWRTRGDPFEDAWLEVAGMLSVEPKLVFLDEFAAGIESAFLVTETGHRLISHTPVQVFIC